MGGTECGSKDRPGMLTPVRWQCGLALDLTVHSLAGPGFHVTNHRSQSVL